MAANLNEAQYKNEQIKFVSNNHGTTARETLLLLIPCVCGILLMVTTRILIGKRLNYLVQFIIEFVVVILPSVLCYTIYSEEKILVSIALLSLSLTNLIAVAISSRILGNDVSPKRLSSLSTRRPFITNFRALTNVLTAICILAVDFRAFPRRYAKTENYGFSLMDTGVGFFMMSNSLVSPEARDFGQKPKSGFVKTAVKNFTDCVRSCIPLLILGSARYFSVEYLNYQRHVTEYGVHWNFFVTLAAVKVLTSVITSFVRPRRSLIVGILILAGYEYVLNLKSFRQWLFGASRTGFVDANKEGIVSTVGYVGLYFVGVALGRLIHSTYNRAAKDGAKKSQDSNYFRLFIFDAQYSESMILCVKLSLITAQACLATILLDGYFRVSRKLANAGYCAWMITLTTALMTLLLLVDVMTDVSAQLVNYDAVISNDQKKKVLKDSNAKDDVDRLTSTPEILEAINFNGLAYFLVSNLLTGAVNMSMRTLYINDLDAVQIITVYMILGIGLFVLLYRFKIQIKL